MKNNGLIKLLTISVFIVLISLWIAYKTGSFETDSKNLSTQTNGLNHLTNNTTVAVNDTSPKILDSTSENLQMFSTSKSMIIIDQHLELESLTKFPFSDSSETKKNN